VLTRILRISVAALPLLLSIACGSRGLLAPSSQVSGAWLANSTLVSVGGGECLGATILTADPPRDIFTTALKQNGSTLEATVASAANGTSCAYTGTIDGTALVLNLTSCQAARVAAARCANGALRDLQLTSGSIVATVNGQTSGSGTETSTWSVFEPGKATPLAAITLSARFVWNFLGVPSSDYHVFTGTVFPGYADGTISIEGTETFCVLCGWFRH
jgi:hypothetical protein